MSLLWSKIGFALLKLGEAAEQVASDKGWGRPLATVATGQKNGGNGKVTIVEAKAGVNATPSKSSHKVGDERFEQGHSRYTQSMLRHMEEKLALTGDVGLKETLRLIKSAAQRGKLTYKVVHQRIDSNGQLGKLTITDYKQERSEVLPL